VTYNYDAKGIFNVNTIKIFLDIKEVDPRKENYYLAIYRLNKTTYQHLFKIMGSFIESGLLTSRIDGRKTLLSLTPKGKKVRNELHNLIAITNNFKLMKGGKLNKQNDS
jgi:predicted transcriptional regulator